MKTCNKLATDSQALEKIINKANEIIRRSKKELSRTNFRDLLRYVDGPGVHSPRITIMQQQQQQRNSPSSSSCSPRSARRPAPPRKTVVARKSPSQYIKTEIEEFERPFTSTVNATVMQETAQGEKSVLVHSEVLGSGGTNHFASQSTNDSSGGSSGGQVRKIRLPAHPSSTVNSGVPVLFAECETNALSPPRKRPMQSTAELQSVATSVPAEELGADDFFQNFDSLYRISFGGSKLQAESVNSPRVAGSNKNVSQVIVAPSSVQRSLYSLFEETEAASAAAKRPVNGTPNYDRERAAPAKRASLQQQVTEGAEYERSLVSTPSEQVLAKVGSCTITLSSSGVDSTLTTRNRGNSKFATFTVPDRDYAQRVPTTAAVTSTNQNYQSAKDLQETLNFYRSNGLANKFNAVNSRIEAYTEAAQAQHNISSRGNPFFRDELQATATTVYANSSKVAAALSKSIHPHNFLCNAFLPTPACPSTTVNALRPSSLPRGRRLL